MSEPHCFWGFPKGTGQSKAPVLTSRRHALPSRRAFGVVPKLMVSPHKFVFAPKPMVQPGLMPMSLCFILFPPLTT